MNKSDGRRKEETDRKLSREDADKTGCQIVIGTISDVVVVMCSLTPSAPPMRHGWRHLMSYGGVPASVSARSWLGGLLQVPSEPAQRGRGIPEGTGLAYNLSRTFRAWRISTAYSRRIAFASLLCWPCFQAPLSFPFGAPPLAP
jgi:hypothetical protein